MWLIFSLVELSYGGEIEEGGRLAFMLTCLLFVGIVPFFPNRKFRHSAVEPTGSTAIV